jgi:hypothetical protein
VGRPSVAEDSAGCGVSSRDVDDRAVELTGMALPIAPGPHTVSINPQDVPPFMVPLGPLSCPIVAVAGGVAVCDFAFRHAGAP